MRHRTTAAMGGLAGFLILFAATPAPAFDGDPHWRSAPTGPAPSAVEAAAPADRGEMFGFDFTPDDCAETRTANQALGGLVGGVVGGLIGSGIGKGSGRTAATIGGTVLGALGGAALGDKVAGAGERCLERGSPDDPPLF